MNNYIYLDLNVFDRLEKLERLTFEEAEPYKFLRFGLDIGDFRTLFSHAHITDLIRAYNPDDDTSLKGHLGSISALTKNTCVFLVDGNVDVTVAEIDIFDYFNLALEESSKVTTTADIMAQYPEQFNDDSPISPEMVAALEHPLIQKLYPKTFRTRMTKSILEDMIDGIQRLHEDSELFRQVKKLMNPANMTEFKTTLPPGEKLNKEVKRYLKKQNLEARLDKYGPQGQTSENEWYDRIVNLYIRTDFKGFKTDREFTGLLNDAQHTFYAAHCAAFVTNDSRCHYKASEVYNQLNLKTKVFTAKEFYEYAMSNLPKSDESS